MRPHRVRVLAMQALFQDIFYQRTVDEYLEFLWVTSKVPDDEKQMVSNILHWVLHNKDWLETLMIDYSENWMIERISPITKAILMLSLYQLKEQFDTIPPEVVIHEALRLSEHYAEKNAGRFINGILDAYYKDLQVKK